MTENNGVLKSPISRKLGSIESCHLMGENLLHTNIVIYGTVHASIDESRFRHALNKIQIKHPLLNAFIKPSYFRKPVFIMDSAPSEIPIAIMEAPYDKREGVIEDILNTIFPINKSPLMRSFIIKHPGDATTIALYMSHTIADGFSGLRIMGSLLNILDKSEKETLSEHSEPAMPEAAESYFPKRTRGLNGLLNYLKLNMKLISDISSSPKQTLPSPQTDAPVDKRRMIFTNRVLSRNETLMIRKRAREENTTVNAAITAAHFIALSEECERCENRLPSFRSMVIMSNIDLRRRLKNSHDEVLTDFASIANNLVSADSKSNFWDIARNYQESLVTSIKEDEPFLHVFFQKIMWFVTGWSGFNTRASMLLNRVMSKFEQKMTLVSNVGVVDLGPKEGKYKLIFFAGLSSSRMSQTILSITLSLNGELIWTVIGNHPIHSRDRLERLAERMTELIRLMAS
ncbi:MAG: hypothetical protein KKD44_21670 [Proteobacteria bacterium]|nr:hypothetical protein [Pseudomonadota bacterium]